MPRKLANLEDQTSAATTTEELGPFERFDQARRSSVDQVVVVYRNESGKTAYVGQMPAHDWTPDLVRDRFGGGLYKFRLRHTDTQAWGMQMTMAIAALEPRAAPTTIIHQQQPAASEINAGNLVQLLIQQQTQLMGAIITAQPRQAAGGSDADAIFRAIELGTRLARPNLTPTQAEENDDDEDDGLASLVKSVVDAFKPKPSPVPRQAPRGTLSAPAPSSPQEIASVIEHLVRAATKAKAINPKTYADTIIGAVGVEEMRAIVGNADSLTDVLIANYPDLAGHADRLEDIEEAIRDRLGGPNHAGDTGTDAPAG